ncbi:MAG TPA: amidohydrolase family protein [Stellaceae bacterium]|jgi:N-acyl-D-aspartate/D-glutamate deacylase|nr:amidohydrolase family protein [Stellaceae bacterium]
MAYDLLIKNGRVVDGSGAPAFNADVAVQDGKIVGVGKYAGSAATRTIDAEGRVVAPGFIDHHTHFDPQAVWDPYCGSSVQNGHTTIVVGQCGQVIAPVRPGDAEWYLQFFSDAEQIPLPVLKAGVDVTWESVGDYMNALGRKRGCNVGALIGHSGIRRYVMGEAASERVQATPEELAAMQRLVREAMYDGALGFSTAPKDRGDPAGHCDNDERWALASVLGELGTGIFQVAGGAPGGTAATRKIAQELAARTGRPSIYNLVSQPIERPEEWQQHLQWLEESFKTGARCYGSCTSVVAGAIFDLLHGLDVPQDEDITNPNGLFRGMPTWDRVMALPSQDRIKAFRDPETRKALSAEAVEGTVAQTLPGTNRRGVSRGFFNRRWDLVQVFMTQHERNRGLEGKSIAQIAQDQGKSVMDAFLDLSLDEDLQTYFIGVDRNTDPAAQKAILGSQYTVIGTSDGGARPHSQDRQEYSTHLLSHWVREQQALTLEDAVYRLTGKTALMHDMHDRGFVQAGKIADLTVFDPDTIASKPREPSYTMPTGSVQVKRDAVGIDHVVVNGTVLLDNGQLTDALPGQIIRNPLYQGARA